MPAPAVPIRTSPLTSRPAGGPSAPFDAALRAWAAALGERSVSVADDLLARYGRTTGVRGRRPRAVLFPDSTGQVQRALEIANQFGIPVYPISKGKNWGYGDAGPTGDGQVVIDLGRMNRIVEVNPELAYAVIEPGVTQGQLYRHLSEQKLPLWMDASGAGLEASIIGNTLERGFGHTRYGDHFLTTCGMEVVLADGRILNTGFGHYPQARAHRAYRYGIGPFLDGIFSQSNFGVVTRMGVWLMPAPEDFCVFYASAASDGDLPGMVDALAALRRQGIVQSTVHVANDLRVISGRMRYPWERAGGRTPLPDALRDELRRECDLGAWNTGGAIYGTRETVAAARKVIRRALRAYRLRFLTDRTLNTAERVRRLLGRVGLGASLGERIELVKPLYGLMKGIPTNEPLRGAAWRVRGPLPAEPADPLDCNAGLIWTAPTLPATGAAAREVMSLMAPLYEKYGFEALATFTLITERAMCCVSNVSFDRREADEAARAKACHDELTDLLIGRGYLPYRCGPDTMRKLARGSSGFWDVASQLKQALDPKGIISPGRYEPAA
jgi:4-cresol dehydrogenase (hydroxylating) flavoprotein subunit